MYILILLLLLIIFLYTNNNNNEGFIDLSNDVYVINLDSRPDRMKKIMQRFPSLNINRITAMKHEDGWKGCGLSHISVIKMAKEMGLPFVLIMEDDCVPTDAFVHWPKIQTWLENHREQWDIFVGGNSYYGISGNDNSISPICNLDPIRIYNTKVQTMHFYYLNSSAYDRFLEWENNIVKDIDLWANKQNMKSVSCVPFIAKQDKDFSNITKKEENYDRFFEVSANLIGTIENITECFSTLVQQ